MCCRWAAERGALDPAAGREGYRNAGEDQERVIGDPGASPLFLGSCGLAIAVDTRRRSSARRTPSCRTAGSGWAGWQRDREDPKMVRDILQYIRSQNSVFFLMHM